MYQTRSEITGMGNFKTIKEALEAAAKDDTVWKISFNSEAGDRIRLVRKGYTDFVLELLEF